MPLKAVADKRLVSAEAPKEPPLPAPESPPPADAGEHPFVNKEVVASPEAAKFLFGREGTATKFSTAKNQYHVFSAKGTFYAEPQRLALKASRPGTRKLAQKKNPNKMDIFQVGFFDSTGVSPSRTHRARAT